MDFGVEIALERMTEVRRLELKKISLGV